MLCFGIPDFQFRRRLVSGQAQVHFAVEEPGDLADDPGLQGHVALNQGQELQSVAGVEVADYALESKLG